ncbi:hypothetical protein ACIBHY_06450 [Nonomuraea sp. NPDC050547]|uniref:hypothetical protein n=1 Tax=unclassified Nonomuraea TaxID=2593643 RepID=UPI00379BFA61
MTWLLALSLMAPAGPATIPSDVFCVLRTTGSVTAAPTPALNQWRITWKVVVPADCEGRVSQQLDDVVVFRSGSALFNVLTPSRTWTLEAFNSARVKFLDSVTVLGTPPSSRPDSSG